MLKFNRTRIKDSTHSWNLDGKNSSFKSNFYIGKIHKGIIMFGKELLLERVMPVVNGTPMEGPRTVVVQVDVSPILYLDIIVSLGNIVLLLLLLYIYWDNYKKIKSIFTTGLIMFAGILLLQNIIFTSFLLFRPIFQIAELGLPLFIVNITEFLALLILLLITWRS